MDIKRTQKGHKGYTNNQTIKWMKNLAKTPTELWMQNQNRLLRRTEETGTKGPHIKILWVKRKGSSEGNFNPSSVLTDVGIVENIIIIRIEEAPYPRKFSEV